MTCPATIPTPLGLAIVRPNLSRRAICRLCGSERPLDELIDEDTDDAWLLRCRADAPGLSCNQRQDARTWLTHCAQSEQRCMLDGPQVRWLAELLGWV